MVTYGAPSGPIAAQPFPSAKGPPRCLHLHAIMPAITSTPPPRKITPTSRPVSVLAHPAAQLYSHIHPVLLLSLFYLAFPALVADPVSSLQSALLPLSALQLFYTALCLPTSARRSSLLTALRNADSKPRPTKRPSSPKNSTLGGRITVCRMLPPDPDSPNEDRKALIQ